MEQALIDLNGKLDALTAQVAYLTEQAHKAEYQRQERAEFMQDVMPIMNGAYALTVEQLDEVKQYVELGDWLRLGKRLLRNGPNIEKLLEQLESVSDLLEGMGPLSNAAFDKTVDTLQDMEQRGYFTFAKGSMQIIDNIVTSFGEEDVKRLGDNVVLILNTIKEMTQPQIMGFVRNFVANVELETAKPVNTSLPALLGQLRDPNVRRGLALTMRALHVIGAQTQATQSPNR
ncbi:MAG: hypothetical protein NT075_27385 [Chloroflexi bacterium]|nr:hypothetical protein [Chloroflexota bacterium]